MVKTACHDSSHHKKGFKISVDKSVLPPDSFKDRKMLADVEV